ncbi:MAG TPA: aromatic aminobenezylarsenical efflux permease ArsG family transporter [Bacteroidales bacterium]|jgi:sulfite exporter TauE/SafE|nr:aromatic aminobenezylarsenical efflux permease ArsG family transporter [Bacteroidales bacterium]HOG56318.1 aromatic aminobenezylarsenical efflux permease ArsG family transporter [Bacteroidales bacterium]HPX44490.1 aromatic aminobenezylarsenical efflux permease ArsG family transporter [Bacteroidales bacterium]HQB86936.1 aromatic aminobenezylarsenical efflux permease ArsG family transporter [Bacteroidales bacterium]
MMQHLQQLLESAEAPFFYVLILGILTAVSPCQFARNIAAVGYISRNIRDTRKVFINGLFYTLGNAAAYFLIAFILFLGASKFKVSKFLVSNSNIAIGLILIIVGLFMLDVFKVSFSGGGRISRVIEKIKPEGKKLDSAILGFLFALSFCPYNAALFFGMLIPLSIKSAGGLYLPVVYSLSAGLPVIIIAWLIAYSVSGIGAFYNKVKVFQVWFNRIVAGIFIVAGLYFIYRFVAQLVV